MRKRKNKIRADTQFSIFLKGNDEEIEVGYTRLSQNPDVQKCANIIADRVSDMTIMLMANGENGDTRIKNQLSRKLDITPCSYMTRKNLIFKIAKELILTGNSLAFVETEEASVNNIIPLKSSKAAYEETQNGYRIIYGGTCFEPDEILHFVWIPNLEYPYKGEGCKRAVIDTVQNIAQAQATKRKFLKSKWKPSLIISVDADSSELQDPVKRDNILDSYFSDTEAGKPWLIPSGELKVEQVKPLTLEDLAINDSIKIDKQDIASAFNVPPFLIGIGEFKEDAYNNFIATTVMSVATVIQQELTKKLILSENMYAKFNDKSLYQYALKDKKDFVSGMVSTGMMTRNEGRSEFDYSPADDEGMNEYVVLENYIPVSKAGDQKKLKDGE